MTLRPATGLALCLFARLAEFPQAAAASDPSVAASRAPDGDPGAPPPEVAEGEGRSTDEIVVTAERLAEPARPDTSLRITGRQLAERGVTTLGQALDLVADTPVRGSGRQLSQVNVRGARKGGVLLLLDGTPIADPFHGNFDVASIPATDIAEIRVSLTPASPLDGPGGNGGVVEVLTRSATGSPFVRVQAQRGTSPSGQAAGTGRFEPFDRTGVRISASGAFDDRDLPVTLEAGERHALDAELRQGTAGLRVEHRLEGGRLSLDLAGSRRRFVIPPAEELGAGVSRIPEETLARGVVGGRLRRGSVVGSVTAYAVYFEQSIENFRDATRDEVLTRERIDSHRVGGHAQVDLTPIPDLRVTAATHVLFEGGEDELRSTGGITRIEGEQPVVLPAAGAFWQAAPEVAIDGAVGVAVPIGVEDAAPCPEAKLTATVTPADALQLRLVGARKGRLPSLRDRFSPTQGNEGIAPETGTSVEGSVVYEPTGVAALEVSGFWRLTEGLIRVPPARPRGQGGLSVVENAGDVTVRGFEVRAEASPIDGLTGGGAFALADATSEALGDDPLDFFPETRAEVFAQARWQTYWGVWARVRRTGTRIDNGTELKAYTTVDASVWAEVEPIRVTLRAENLGDTSYDLRTSVPGYGRTVYLGAEGTFR